MQSDPNREMREDFVGFYARKADAQMYAAFYRERGLDAKVVGQRGDWRIRLLRPVAVLPEDFWATDERGRWTHEP